MVACFVLGVDGHEFRRDVLAPVDVRRHHEARPERLIWPVGVEAPTDWKVRACGAFDVAATLLLECVGHHVEDGIEVEQRANLIPGEYACHFLSLQTGAGLLNRSPPRRFDDGLPLSRANRCQFPYV